MDIERPFQGETLQKVFIVWSEGSKKKKVENLSPWLKSIYSLLAELYSEMGVHPDARRSYSALWKKSRCQRDECEDGADDVEGQEAENGSSCACWSLMLTCSLELQVLKRKQGKIAVKNKKISKKTFYKHETEKLLDEILERLLRRVLHRQTRNRNVAWRQTLKPDKFQKQTMEIEQLNEWFVSLAI